MISIDIPLLERTTYRLYKIHPYPVFQNLVGNITGTAYILPKESYIALSYDDQKFILVNQEYHDLCTKTIFHTICDANQPIYTTSISQFCEIQMLIKPSTETFKKCDIRIILHKETFWTQILSLQAGLYSKNKPELLSISCPNQKPVRKIINNSGLLRLGSGCTAMTTSITLTGITVYKTNEEYIYSPEISLNLTNISPTMAKFPKFLTLTTQELQIPSTFGKITQRTAIA